ncbi:MAG: TlpA disulfide reductase family protein [Planctomycetota bacterium]
MNMRFKLTSRLMAAAVLGLSVSAVLGQGAALTPKNEAASRAEVQFDAAWSLPNGDERDVALNAFRARWRGESLGENDYLLPLAALMTASDEAKPQILKDLSNDMVNAGALSLEEIERLGGAGMTRTIIDKFVAMPFAGELSLGNVSKSVEGFRLLASVWSPADAYLFVGSELRRLDIAAARAELDVLSRVVREDERINQAEVLAVESRLERVTPGQRSMAATRGLQMTGRSRWAPASSGVNEMGFRAVSGPGLDGEPVSSDSHLGKVVVVHYWDSTCSGCVKQSSELVALREEFSEQDVEIIGVNINRNAGRNDISEAAARLGLDWDHVYTGEGWRTPAVVENEVVGIPLVVVLDRQGRPRDSSMGTRRLRGVIRRAVDEGAVIDPPPLERLQRP